MKNVNISKVVKKIQKEIPKFNMPVISDIGLRKDPYRVLISCILSLRTKDETTAPASNRLFKEAQDVNKLAGMEISKIEKLIYPVGFYKTKARRIKDIANTIITQYDGKVPDEIDELLKLKGVGRKTANIVVTIGFKKPGIAVDTHVHRISNRLGYVVTKTPDRTETALREKLPQKHWLEYTELLVTWGQNICRPISPWCSKCVVRSYCKRIGVKTCR
ncbi:endonuclease III [Candidatus Woesearchaeota archaeon]|nr:endonuclease III [Candidatus Woesearchaeota archaeon]